jgi:hypothetical protein
MDNKTTDILPKDQLWKEEYKKLKPNLREAQISLLDRGPQNLAQAWILNGMRRDWEKLTGLRA